MNKEEIKEKLHENHESFIALINGLSEESFMESTNLKWTPGQQLEHIFLSVKPVRQVFGLPKFLPGLIWGKANRTSRNFEDLIAKYLQKLENGGRATGMFIPKTVSVEKGKRLFIRLQKEVSRLCSSLDSLTEKEMDKYIIPHPLLGKLTFREMMFFTIYHVSHHEKLTIDNLGLNRKACQ